MTAKLLYLPNEREEGQQAGFRRALNETSKQGLLQHIVFSPLARLLGGQSGTAMRDELLATVSNYRPDAILLQHPVGTGLRTTHYRAIRATMPPKSLFVYHEDDPYARLRHPLPVEGREAAAIADIVYTCGRDSFPRILARNGAKDVRYSIHCYDEVAFPPMATRSPGARPFDVAVVANRQTAIRPWRRVPGARSRERMVTILKQQFGDRLAVYGANWPTATGATPLPYLSQRDGVRSARVFANWDHFPREAAYFSDRLPIAMSARVPQVTTWHPEIEELLGGAPERLGVFPAKSPRQVIDRVKDVLTRTDTELDDLAAAGEAYAREHLSQGVEYKRLIAELLAECQGTRDER